MLQVVMRYLTTISIPQRLHTLIPSEVRQASTDPLQNLDAAAKQQLLLKLLAESPDIATLLTALTGKGA